MQRRPPGGNLNLTYNGWLSSNDHGNKLNLEKNAENKQTNKL